MHSLFVRGRKHDKYMYDMNERASRWDRRNRTRACDAGARRLGVGLGSVGISLIPE